MASRISTGSACRAAGVALLLMGSASALAASPQGAYSFQVLTGANFGTVVSQGSGVSTGNPLPASTMIATNINMNPSSGSILTPAEITFGDNLGTNLTGVSNQYVDNFEFSVAPTLVTASVGGINLSLTNFTLSGSVVSFSLYSGSPTGTNTLLTSGTVTSSFQQILLSDITNSGNYYLQVVSKDQAVSTANYSGTILLTAAPEPSAVGLLAIGLLGLFGAATVRRHRAR